jgi:serine protease Do
MRVEAIALLICAAIAAFGQTASPTKISGGSYLGVMVQEIDSDRAKALKLPEEAGVEITRIDMDSPADKAGLKAGDVLWQYNGQRVEGMEQLSRMVHETPPGREVKLNIYRDGAAQTVTGKIGTRHVAANVPAIVPPTVPDFHIPDVPRSFMGWRSSTLGVEAEALDGQLAQYFGVKEGVLVRSVVKGSAAEKAGIKAGDVITKIGDARVATPADISSQLHSLRGKSAPLVLMRDRKEMNISVALDDDRAQGGLWALGAA